jgi:hypothetical protein
MKWLVVISIAALSVLAATSTAAAEEPKGFECNGTFTGATIKSVIVPDNGGCALLGSTVTGNVDVGTGAYFEASGTTIQGSVKGKDALTIYTHDGSSIGGSVKTKGSTQLFLFDGSVGGSVQAGSSVTNDGHVQVCGMTIGKKVQIQKGGTDILVGDSLAGCGGNTIGGDLKITDNFTDVELDVRDNTIGGNLMVSKNQGPSDKFVVNNTGGKKLQCDDNIAPFVGTPNSGFATVKAGSQCTL